MKKIFALLFALVVAVPAFAQTPNDVTRNLYIIDASGHLITLGAPGGMTGNTTITFPTSGGTVLTSAPSGGSQVTNFGSSSSQGDFLLWDANGNSLTFKTVANLGLSGGNDNLIWPKNASGVLTNDGSGNLSWAASSGSVPSTFTKGSLLYGSAANTWSALPGSSTDGWVLTWDAATGLPKWASAGSGGSSFGAITLTGASNQINVQANGTGNKYIITGTNPVSGDLTYTIPDAGANASFVMTAGNQTIGGTKTFSSTISGDINGNAATVTNGVYTTGNQSIGGTKTFTNQTVVFDQNGATTGAYTFNFGTPTADNVITFPNSGGELTLMGNTFNGANQLLKLDASGKLPAIDGSALTNLSATNFSSGTVSATRGGTGLSTWTKGSVLYADAANSWAALPGTSTDGWVLSWNNTTGLPEWRSASSGGSTFSPGITVGTASTTTGVISVKNAGNTNTQTISGTSGASAATFSLPNVGTNADFVVTEGNQTINGTKTFAGTVKLGSNATLDASAVTTAQTYSLPATGGTLAIAGTSIQNNSTNFSSLGVNIGASTPNTNLDVNGDVAYRASTNSTTGTTLNNVSTSSTSNIRITGATGNFIVSGFGNGYNGKKLHIYNATSYKMTLANNSSNSSSGNKILTMAGGDVTLEPTGTDGSSVDLTYDANALSGTGAWIMQGAETYRTTGVLATGTAYSLDAGENWSADGSTTSNLGFSAIAGQTYEVRGVLMFKATTGNSETIGIGFSDNSTGSAYAVSVNVFANGTGTTGIHGSGVITTGGSSGMVTSGSLTKSTTNYNVVQLFGIVKAGTTGTVNLLYNWTGGGSGDQLVANSYLSVTRVN